MEIQKAKTSINNHLDQLLQKLLRDLDTSEETESKKIGQLLNEIEKQEKEIADFIAWLENFKQYASELQIFLAAKEMEHDITKKEQFVQSIMKSGKLNHSQISWKIETIFQNIAIDIKSFGEIIVDNEPSKLMISRQKHQEAQHMIAAPVPKSIDNMTLTLRQTVNTDAHNVRGCTILPDGRMVFTCFKRQKFIAINNDGTKDFEMKLDRCFDIDYIDYNIMFVTSGTGMVFSNIVLFDIEKRKVGRKLNVGEYNEGAVVTNDETLVYCAGKNGLKTIDLNNGTKGLIRSGPLGISGYSYVTSFDKHIIYTNPDNNTVTCIDFQGMIQWQFKEESVLKCPQGISIDYDGNVYVVGAKSNTVVVISHDGKRHRQILSSNEGLSYPYALHYDQSTNSLLVANDQDHAFLFTVK